MKWKEFFASTLPRSKKSRRKSKQNNTEQTGSLSSPETDDVVIHNQKVRSCSDVINSNKKKKKPVAVSNGNVNQLTQIAYNRQLVSPDFQYFTENNTNSYTNPYGHNTLSKTPSNTSESGFEDGYEYIHNQSDISWCCSVVEPEQPQNQDLLFTFNQTFPRERTRIKTNPWVSEHSKFMTSSLHADVSPRSPMMTSSYHEEVYRSPLMTSSFYSDSGERSPVYNPNSPVFIRDFENNTMFPSLPKQVNKQTDNNGTLTREHNWFTEGLPDGTTVVDNTSKTNTPDRSYDVSSERNGNKIDAFDSSEAGVVEGGDLVINLKTGDVFVKPKPLFSPVSFQYEDDLEATLERDAGNKKKKKRSRRNRDEEYFYIAKDDTEKDWEKECEQNDGLRDVVMEYLQDTPTDTDTDTGRVETDNDGTLTKGNKDAWTYQSSADSSFRRRGLHKRVPLHDDQYELTNTQDIHRTFSYTPYDSLYHEIIDKSHLNGSRTGCHSDAMFEPSYHREGTDSAYESSTMSSLTGSSFHGRLSSLEKNDHWADTRPMTLPSIHNRPPRSHLSSVVSNPEGRRSLEEIKESLKEKVDRLKAEKRIVDEKVKHAREEEELRRQERAKIQQQVSTLRKQVLLSTLQDLKDNLEDQNKKLQEAYDDVLDMQWINSKLRRMRNTTI